MTDVDGTQPAARAVTASPVGLAIARAAKMTAIGAFFLPWVSIEGCGQATGQQIAALGNALLYAVPLLLVIGLLASLDVRRAVLRFVAIHDAELCGAIALVVLVQATHRLSRTAGEFTRVLSSILTPIVTSPGDTYGAWLFLSALFVMRIFGARGARGFLRTSSGAPRDLASPAPPVLGALSILVGLAVAAAHLVGLFVLSAFADQLSAHRADWPDLPGVESVRLLLDLLLGIGADIMIAATVAAGLLVVVGGLLWRRHRWSRPALLGAVVVIAVVFALDHGFFSRVQAGLLATEDGVVRQIVRQAIGWLHVPLLGDQIADRVAPDLVEALFSSTNAELSKYLAAGQWHYFRAMSVWPLLLVAAFGGTDARRYFVGSTVGRPTSEMMPGAGPRSGGANGERGYPRAIEQRD